LAGADRDWRSAIAGTREAWRNAYERRSPDRPALAAAVAFAAA
jgi:hypothetical protein